MRARLIATVLCTASISSAQTDLPPEVLLLSRIKQHMKARLLQVPNYTCLETVERWQQVSASAKFKPVDTVRVEVAEVAGKELFARPGRQFDETNPSAFTARGLMANGIFSLHSRALFISDRATFTFAGEEEVGGRKFVRYDFHVPYLFSGYKISIPGRSAVVAYHGSVWSDPQSLDAFHFRVVAENIPPVLGVMDAGLDIEYQTVQIGASDALLPKRAELLLTEFSGRKLRNIIAFTACRQNGSESVISFDAPVAPKPK
jgi:hypothetical protein